jgi:K+-sensing histidine kinase KdpD
MRALHFGAMQGKMDSTHPHTKAIMGLMKLKNAKSWRPQGLRPLYTSMLGFIAAFGLRYALAPFVDEALSMLFFAVNCIVISYLFGYLYALGLLTVSIPTAMFFFRKPFYTLDGINNTDIFMIIVYTVIITTTALIIEWLQRERYAAVLQQRVSETRYRLLIESDQARRAEYTKQFEAAPAQDA